MDSGLLEGVRRRSGILLLWGSSKSPASHCPSWPFLRLIESGEVLGHIIVLVIPLGNVGLLLLVNIAGARYLLLLLLILLWEGVLLVWGVVLRAGPGSLVEEGGGCHGLHVETHGFGLLQDSVETVN